MNAIIYCRVSSPRQVVEGHGLESQETLCRNYAKSKGYEVIAVFKEKGITGGLFEREAMKEMVAFLEEKDTNDPKDKIVVIFDDLKRFARDVEVHFKLKQEIYTRNAIVESPNFKFEDTPEGKFVETIVAATGALEKDQNRRQVLQKMKARLENGYWPFMPPKGLVNKKDPIHGKILEPCEPHASIFKKAIEQYRDGILITQDEVRLCLHEEYRLAGLSNRPSLSTTVDILKNPLYAGYIEYADWGVPLMKAKHEGFISLETYNIVQERLQGRTKPWKRRDYSTDFPLRPHVLCTGCNKPMTASWNKGRSAKYPNYFCRTKGCIYNWKVVNKQKIEGEFEVLLSGVKPADGLIDLTKDILQEQWDIRLQKHVEYRARIASEINEADEAIKSYLERIRKTNDDDLIAIYEEEIKTIKKRKKQGEQALAKQIYTSQQFGTASEKVFNTLKKPMDMWKSDEYNDKRTILFMYFEEELKYDYKLGFGTASLAYPIKLINELGQAKKPSVEMSGNDPESE